MPEVRWRVVSVVALLIAAVVLSELSFQEPAVREGDVDLVESSTEVMVSVRLGSLTSNSTNSFSTLEFHEVKDVQIERMGSLHQIVSAGLFFEVLNSSRFSLKSVDLLAGEQKQRLANSVEFSQLEYVCCGEDSKLRLTLPSEVVPLGMSELVLEFALSPGGCEYDRPKVLCKFERATRGGPVVIDGGSMLLTSFEGLDLREAVITNTDLRGSSFVGADLRGAIFKLVDIREVDFTGARIEKTIFRQITSDVMLGRP